MNIELEIWAPGVEDKHKCGDLINGKFFHFIDSYSDFEEESILSTAGRIYKLNLTPFSKYVYLEDEPDEEEVDEVLQNTSGLRELTEKFIAAIKKNPRAIEGQSYKSYDDSFSDINEEVMEFLDESTAGFFLDGIKSHAEETKRKQEENPYPWNSYFSEGEIVTHLEEVLNILSCLEKKGVEKVYFVAV